MAYKTFVNGFPLNASELNNNFMNQVISTFADASARSTAIAAPVEGQITYLTGTNDYWKWDGSAWVELEALSPDFSATSSPNYIINGAFDVWQRGTSFSAGAVAYSADRWVSGRASSAAGSTLSRSTDVPANFTYSSKMQRDSGNSATNALSYTHRFEDAGIELAGKEVTVSFYAKAGADFSGSDLRVTQFSSSADWSAISFASDGTFAGANPDFSSNNTTRSITTSWQRLTYTFTVDATANSLLLAFRFTPTGTAGADDSVYITGVQLEAGGVATPFKRNAPSLQGELAACQRYYWQISNSAVPSAFGYVRTSTTVRSLIPTPVQMRTAPTLSGETDADQVFILGTSITSASHTVLFSTAQGVHIESNVGGSYSTNNAATTIFPNIKLSAEL